MIQLRQYPTHLERIPDGFLLVYRRRQLQLPEGYRLGIHEDGWVFHESEMGVGPMFGGQPVGSISPDGMEMLRKFLPKAGFSELPEMVYDERFGSFSHPFLDSWYLWEKGNCKVVQMENDLQPPGITFLHNLVQKVWVEYRA